MIELLVSIAIMVVIMSVILVNYSQFNNSFSTTNLAYDIALSIRQAQNYAEFTHLNPTSLPCTTNGTLDPYGCGYGIHFDSNDQNHYILFAYTPSSSNYTPYNTTVGYQNNTTDDTIVCASTMGCIQEYTLPAGYKLSFCFINQNINGYSTSNCTTGAIGITHNILDIAFDRPNPNAEICPYNGGTSCNLSAPRAAQITVTSSSNNTKTILICPSGQISVGATSC